MAGPTDAEYEELHRESFQLVMVLLLRGAGRAAAVLLGGLTLLHALAGAKDRKTLESMTAAHLKSWRTTKYDPTELMTLHRNVDRLLAGITPKAEGDS